MDLKPYLDFARETAYTAGRLTLGYFNAGVRPEFKSDDTPVTVADKKSEELIRSKIAEKFPGHAIVGEEYGEQAGQGNPFRWIIDPIDGTKSFVRGVPLYGVLIGLEIEGEARVGAAYYPALDEMLCAADGEGCWWNGRRAHVSEIDTLAKSYVCIGSHKSIHKYNRQAEYDRLVEKSYAMRGWSDCYGYLLVATGRAEVMIDPLMAIWDCGPFPAIFREAGGYFGSWSGKPGHTHNEALACNAAIKDELLGLIANMLSLRVKSE
jgi:myo-inositol-1(or 4)-monophosphatase